MADNDGRKPVGFLPSVDLPAGPAVVQVIAEQTGETVYVRRLVGGKAFAPPVFAPGKYTVKIGVDRPDQRTLTAQEPLAR
jgi:hypothetical protein